jgi:quinol-cytochrome oxidoreductase complex cytochrome b subunit
MRPNFFHHLHPPTIPAAQARWRYTLGAGGIAIFLVLILILTGVLEMFFYYPTPAEAAHSIQALTYGAPFGGLLRNLHYWSAQLLLIVSAFHLFRVVFTGAYIPPRRFNYLLGLVLFVFIILLDFTGYILRWDQGIHWALVVGVNLIKSVPWVGNNLYQILVGGTQPGAATLIRFYAWHIFGLALLAVIALIWHAFRVRRDGGIAVPPADQRPYTARISRFELVQREVTAMIWCGSVLLLLSIFIPAPIGPVMADITAPSSEGRAPWFLLWVQQMLKWGNPFVWGVLLPSAVLVILASFSFVFPKPTPRELGRWFPRSNRLAQVTLVVIAFLVLLLTALAFISTT